MDRAAYLLTQLLDQLQKMNPALTGDDEHPVAGRLSLRAGDGRLVGGDALLSEKALDALLSAVTSVNAYAGQAEPEPVLDPLLEADLEEYCIGLPVDHLLSLASTDPQQAVAAFDEAVTDWNGEA